MPGIGTRRLGTSAALWLLAALAGLGALLWLAAGLLRRARLELSNEVTQVLPLPYPALGRPAVAADGRLFVLTAGPRIVALEASGQLLFSKHAPPLRTTEPLVGGDLLLLVGEAGLHGFSLGGEERFRVPLQPAAPPQLGRSGRTYALDAEGTLHGLDPMGRALLRVPLGLRAPRALRLLPDGGIAAAGRTEGGEVALSVIEADGKLRARAALGAAASGAEGGERPLELALTPASEIALSHGEEVLILVVPPPARGRAEPLTIEVRRRITLPGPARSAARVDGRGDVHVYVARGALRELCTVRAAGPARCTGLGPVTAPADGPLVTPQGTVLAPFVDEAALGPRLHGVLAAEPDGAIRRFSLPLAEGDGEPGLQLGAGAAAALFAAVPGQPALFVFSALAPGGATRDPASGQ